MSPLPGIALGEPAPDFALKDLQGRRVQLSRLRGRWVLLNFWGVTCPPCRSEMPALEHIFAELNNRSLTAGNHPTILGVDGDLDSSESVGRFVSGLHVTYPIMVDTTLAVMVRYHVGELPTSLLVDPSGRVRAIYVGAMSAAEIAGGLTGQV